MHRRSDAGFTLIEILVVLAIMGFVLGVVITRGPMRSAGLEARAAAGTLAQGLRAARAQAIATDRVVSVVIDPEDDRFAADNHPPTLLAKGTSIAVLPPTLPGPGQTRIIRFAPDGSASGGRVLLGYGARRVLITVGWLTGQVTSQDGTGS